MGKGGYSGGSSTIWLSEDGTSWQSADAAARQKGNTGKHKAPTSSVKTDNLRAEREARDRRSLLLKFIAQCVTAHMADKLTASAPTSPKPFQRSIELAGGNIKWLEANRDYQVSFHEIYCRFRNEKIPFEKVWGPARR